VSEAASTAAARISVAFPKSELPPGGRRSLILGKREVMVFNVDGKLYAIFNRCPHQQASLEFGAVGGTTLATGPRYSFEFGLEGRIVRCPWHHYEFDLEDGRCLADPDRFRMATYEVREEGDQIRVYA
jgi:3-phenylpropionate/trans-cinnamate dioxygenase ferredoxin subunit